MHPVPRPCRRVGAALAAACLLAAGALSGCTSSSPPVTPTPSTAQPSPTVDPAVRAAELAADLNDTQLVGQVLMPSVSLSDPVSYAVNLVTKYQLGGVILMGNVEDTAAGGTAAQVRAYTDELRAAAVTTEAMTSAGVNLVVATDQEYGWVTRIKTGMVQLPSAMAFGAAARPDLTETAWHGAGAELAAVGIDVDFAPDADVIGSPGNQVIGSRSYGSDANDVATQVAAVVSGLQSAGVGATIKHFPGHGHTTVNSHDALPVLTQSRATLAAQDLPPFQAGIDAGAWVVMSGHLDIRAIDPGVPASFSHKILVDLLRGQMGFTGVVVTDALNMAPAKRWSPGEAAVRAMIAGNDLLLMSPDLSAAQKALLDALHSGRLSRERLVEAVTRVLALKLKVAATKRPELSTVDSPENREAALAAAAAAVTVLRGPCSEPLVTGPVRVSSSGGRGQQAAWLTEALTAEGVSVVSSGGTVVHLVGYGDTSSDLRSSATVTVAMDTPYLLRLSTSEVRVATYSSTQVAMRALAAVIAGTAPATGRSPVEVSGLPRSACLA